VFCENLHFGVSLHLRCMGVGLGMGRVGSVRGSINSPGSGLGQLFGGLGWVWVDEMDLWTTLKPRCRWRKGSSLACPLCRIRPLGPIAAVVRTRHNKSGAICLNRCHQLMMTSSLHG